ncbi:putative CFEM domain-containing protein [Colletotrichum sublineola]|uniref:Putative CFEM domain-containing protein n=1 Tax=Colletotrichum sublineola TaxID=1173701 RepID=A0A066WX87_COLSU|nr:putative CFEM domain-containing protein [Colletotrichum sublineola]
MQIILTLGLLSGLAAAQSATSTAPSSGSSDVAGLVSQLPTCAVSCIEKAASSIGCAATDFACLCKSQDKLISTLTPCVLTAGCSSDQIGEAAKIAPQICALVSNNPAASDIAAASSLVTGALGTASASGAAATASTSPTAAAVRPTSGYFSIVGAGIAALAAAVAL